MTKKEKDLEAELAKRDAEDAVPNSIAALIEEEKHATREEVDRMTNKATDPQAVNIVQSLAAAEEAKNNPPKEEKKKPLSDAEYERRTKLDVSDPLYINPSLDYKG